MSRASVKASIDLYRGFRGLLRFGLEVKLIRNGERLRVFAITSYYHKLHKCRLAGIDYKFEKVA